MARKKGEWGFVKDPPQMGGRVKRRKIYKPKKGKPYVISYGEKISIE